MDHFLRILPAFALCALVFAGTGKLYSLPGESRMTTQLGNGFEEQIERRLEERERRRRQQEKEKTEEAAEEEREETGKSGDEEQADETPEESAAENGFGDSGETGEENGFGDFEDSTGRGLFFTGLLRNDAYLSDPPDLHPRTDFLFNDILEMRLIAEARNKNWKFYTDARFFYYNGEIASLLGTNYEIRLLRAFVRYTGDLHEFSVGKTYINYGNAGLFNPFELDKSVQMTDLQYSREGLLAGEYVLHWQDTGSLKIFGGVPAGPFDYTFLWGVSPSFHAGDFNFGAVALHKKTDFNTAGIYFKGDLLVGVEGAAAFHLDDQANLLYTEANLGVDYSFSEDFIATLMFYYNEGGAADPASYLPSPERFLLARYYLFGSLVWTVDEFLNFQLGAFFNIIDESFIVLPSMNVVIANGLTSTLQIILPSGSGNAEFSGGKLGAWTVLLRMESKF